MKFNQFAWLAIPLLTSPMSALAADLGENNPPRVFFNTQTPSNDLLGQFRAQIDFAQNVITPYRLRINNDVRPHLVGTRDTLLLVKPLTQENQQPIMVIAYDKNGEELGVVNLDSPDQLPKHDWYVEAGGLVERDFEQSDFINPLYISTNAEFAEQAQHENGEYLASRLVSHDLITLTLSNGNWAGRIYLPQGVNPDFNGKTIKLVVNSGYSTRVYANGDSTVYAFGSTVTYRYHEGRWFTKDDMKTNNIAYADNTWSGRLPAAWVQPGLWLQFKQGNDFGYLNELKVGAPSEVIINTIDLGFLTPPRNAFPFATNPALHKDYFQKIPASRLIVSEYEPLHLREVVLPTGVTYTDHSAVSGGWHTGDMRQYIGKILISHGIDNANYGINSTDGASESGHPYHSALITAHNAIGKYKNGTVVHGGSGGNGMVTLDNSEGNEFSHELGHNFGLGHYPGGPDGSLHRPASDINSAWGWDARLNRFVVNFDVASKGTAECCGGSVAPFEGYRFNADAMASGVATSPISKYTLHTPYSLQAIQTFLESRAVFDPSASTGFKRWNATTSTMDEFVNNDRNIDSVEIADLTGLDAIITAQLLTENFALNDDISLNSYNGHYIARVDLPQADASNQGKVVSLKRQSSWSSAMTANGETIRLAMDETRVYRSNGQSWQWLPQGREKVARIPTDFGVPVTTIVGYYDPTGSMNSYIYPALHGAYGFVYPADNIAETSQRCQLKVTLANGQQLSYKLSNRRFSNFYMNKIHVNVKQSDSPQEAVVMCGEEIRASLTIQPPTRPLNYTVSGAVL
ncbi:M66 family metalloprotease [Photobacterium kagoshimensis]|uniref:M66 family metalloprotease n=1 Tax=Photobacterium kagoshimensis TaxID=2910242 RepID=UPI003D0F15EB